MDAEAIQRAYVPSVSALRQGGFAVPSDFGRQNSWRRM